jgi:hypothetical protein
MVTSVSLLIQDGLNYTYTHRSLQEYFAAIYVLNFAGSHRAALFRKMRERLSTDETAYLAFDMDQLVVEDSFLRPLLEDMRLFFWLAIGSRDFQHTPPIATARQSQHR